MILQYLDRLAATSKRTEKMKILEEIRGSEFEEDFKRTVFMAYDPSLSYWIREFQPTYVHDGSLRLDEAFDCLENDIAPRNVSGHEAIRKVEEIHGLLGQDDAEVYARVLARDLRCGVGPSTFNKVFPDLIYVHPYMRCASFNTKNLKNVSFPCYSQVKMDGLYVDVIVNDGHVTYMSRNGKVLDFNSSADNLFLAMTHVFGNVVFMGEAVALDESGKIMDRSKSNGYLNSDEVDPKRLAFYLWDVVDQTDFKNKKSSSDYESRFERLSLSLDQQTNDRVKLVDSRVCKNPAEVKAHAIECVSRGEEGTVIKDRKMGWKDGENKLQVKIKPDFEVDLKVVDYKMGKGRNEGLLGALICHTSDDLLEVSVGIGYKYKERLSLLQDVESMVSDGTVVAVKANDIITNEKKPDMYSLFLPRFLKVRKDKNDADTFARVKEQKNSYEDALELIGQK